MVAYQEALSQLLEALRPLPTEVVPLNQALGRVLAEDLFAQRANPPQAISAMDGYALAHADLDHLPLEVSQRIEAGQEAQPLIPGTAARIFTGAPLPMGADTILIQEDAQLEKNQLIGLHDTPKLGDYVRQAGQDYAKGERLLPKGTRLGVGALALAASANLDLLKVHGKPRVALISSGDELVRPGDPLANHQLVASNAAALGPLVKHAGGHVLADTLIRDDLPSFLKALETDADLILTSGGASVGDKDLLRPALAGAGFETRFARVNVRPGKPSLFAQHDTQSLIGLPGNPVSALVCALLFALPALGALQNLDLRPRVQIARLTHDCPANGSREHFMRAQLNTDGPELQVSALERQDSALLTVLAQANALLIRAPFAPPAKAGERVQIIQLPDLF